MSILSTQPDFLAVFEYGWEWRVKETEPELARYLSLLSGFGKLSRAASCKQVQGVIQPLQMSRNHGYLGGAFSNTYLSCYNIAAN